jgi:hypothetical protein
MLRMAALSGPKAVSAAHWEIEAASRVTGP